jgi:hypothetical protein
MKIIEATFFETFPIPTSERWQKIVLKASIEENEDVRQCLYSLKKQVESFFYEANKADEKKAEEAKKQKNPVNEVYEDMSLSNEEMLVKQIKSCNEIKVLESYKFIVKGKPELEIAYNNRLKELT